MNEDFNQLIDDEMHAQKVRTAGLARRVDVPDSTLRSRLAERNPKLRTMRYLAACLGKKLTFGLADTDS